MPRLRRKNLTRLKRGDIISIKEDINFMKDFKIKFNEREELIIALHRGCRLNFREIEENIGVPELTVNKIFFFEVLVKFIGEKKVFHAIDKYAETEIGNKHGAKEEMLIKLKDYFKQQKA